MGRREIRLVRKFAEAILHGPQRGPSVPNEQADELGEFGKSNFTIPDSCTGSWARLALLFDNRDLAIFQAKQTTQIDKLTVWASGDPVGAVPLELGVYVGSENSIPNPPAVQTKSIWNTVPSSNIKTLWERYGAFRGDGVMDAQPIVWEWDETELLLKPDEKLFLFTPTNTGTIKIVWTLNFSK